MPWLIGFGIGAVAGYLAERELMRRVILPSAAADELGKLAGELSTVEDRNGTQIAVEAYGPTDGPTIVLVHGWLCTGRVWHAQIAGLADRYRIVTFDLPGHGRSSPPSSGVYDINVLGDALGAVLASLPHAPVVVAGHSLGGMAVLNAASRLDQARRKIASVVLISTTSRARVERRASFGIEALARLERILHRVAPVLRRSALPELFPPVSNDLSRLLIRWVGLGPDVDPDVAAFAERMLGQSDPDVALGLVHAISGVDEDAGLRQLAADGIAVSVMVGGRDRLTPRDLSARMVQLGATEMVERANAGHLLPLEEIDAVNAVLERHLQAVTPQGSELTAGRPRARPRTVGRAGVVRTLSKALSRRLIRAAATRLGRRT